MQIHRAEVKASAHPASVFYPGDLACQLHVMLDPTITPPVRSPLKQRLGTFHRCFDHIRKLEATSDGQ